MIFRGPGIWLVTEMSLLGARCAAYSTLRPVFATRSNPVKWLGELIVGTGATCTVLPVSLLRELGVKPIRRVKLRLDGNRVVKRDLGQAEIEIKGFSSMVTPVVFGEEGVYLLGSATLELQPCPRPP